MKNSSLITDVRDLDDDLLLRKVVECSSQAKALERYPEPEVLRAWEDLCRCVKRLEEEMRRRTEG